MSIQEISNVAGLLSLGLTLFVGAIVAFYMVRSGIAKNTNEAQSSAIAAMQAEIATLNNRIEEMEKNENRQRSILSTIRYALKQRGLKIVIEGEFVTLSEAGGKSSKVTRIQDRTAMLDDDETDAS